MKRYVTLITLSLLLCFLVAGASHAIFPGRSTGTNIYPGKSVGFNNVVGDGYVGIQLLKGWVLGVPAWYSCFATNNIRVAGLGQLQQIPANALNERINTDGICQSTQMTLAPKLTSAIGAGAQPMYVVTNYNNNGVVFSTSPMTVAPYTGLWEVIYITWLPGVPRWIITNTAAAVGSAPGLPTPGVQALYSSVAPGTPPDPFAPATVVDCPIFAVGQISNPWIKPTSACESPFVYRIPQGVYLNYKYRVLYVPYWNVYCQDEVTHQISIEQVIIPDVSDEFLASITGANFAPVLASVPISDRSNFFVINWLQQFDPPNPEPLLKVLANQHPLLDACPTECSGRNRNFDYSPIDTFILLNRDISLISPEVLFTNVPFLLAQFQRGALYSVGPYDYPPAAFQPAINAPFLCRRVMVISGY